ncbi:MAG TPA: hypothetical protein PLP25_02120 [Candidatus Limiplasma sp.]|nr:hypothetical protein [Candidatus Limiplasma sp.]HPS80643.1 hypothetical protein [Candidatus Limiplasma sp.]
MAIPVTVKDVERVLRPWLGSLLLSSNTFSTEIACVVMEYAPYRQTLQQLRDCVAHDLLTGINRITGGSMTIVQDNYRTRRLTLRDMQVMTDDIMGLVFDSLTPFSANFEKLNNYALHEESLAAMRVLYQKYRSFFTDDQYRFLIHMIKSIYTPERYLMWMKD